MSKENVLFVAGMACLGAGAYLVHPGLALMVLGVWLLIGSYFEYEKNNPDEEEDEK